MLTGVGLTVRQGNGRVFLWAIKADFRPLAATDPMGVTRKPRPILTPAELRNAFVGGFGEKYPPVLSPDQLASLLGYSRSTVYFWVAEGRFDGAFRKRGKQMRFWRDRALERFFNGPEWSSSGGGDANDDS
jgi:excisionase family DNA binding protein